MKIKNIKVGGLNTNCYFLISEGELLVIDPGAEPNKIIQNLKELEADVVGFINTHSHYDHVGANKSLKDKGIDNLTKQNKLQVGDLNLKIVETPGHKEDCICIIGSNFAFTGDTIFKDVHGRVDLAGGSIKKLEESLEKLSNILKVGMTIYPGHGESFKLKTANLKNKYLKNDSNKKSN